MFTFDPENAEARAFLAAAERGLGAARPAAAESVPARTEAVAAPTSFASGRYEVRRFLGEGGKKRVFLAHDSLLDRDVAFALVRTEGLDATGRERVRREAQAMGRLGNHANLVSVLDLGQERIDGAEQPYIVMEYMGGGSVADALNEAEDHRLPVERTLQIATAVCRGLEFVHANSLIHRDVKPGNIFLAEDGTAKLGDFGLAAALDRTRLTQDSQMLGTAAYMPPEQALGGEVTPQSDLYALGAMLYELVTGRPPFVGDDPTSVISQHINTPPVAPSWHSPACPPQLEALIVHLLEKDPTARPASASDVSRTLDSIDPTQHVPSELNVEQVANRAANPLYRTTFVGREPELKQLQAAFDGAISGQGGLMMVVGEPGIGKTAVTEQLGTYAMLRGGMTLVGHCYEEGSLSLPYLPFVEAMRSYVLDREADDLRSELGSGAGDVARIVSEVRDRIDVPAQEPVPPDEERFRLMQAVTTFLRNAAEVQPLCIVLEDLHDADRGTLDLLNHVARNLQGSRLLIVGTYRDVEVDRAHPLSSALAELRRAASFERVTLRGLTPVEVQRMLNNLADQEVPFQLAEAIFRQTEGNPLFVQEVIRFLSEEGLIARTDGQWANVSDQPLAMQIPEGLRDVIGKRLSRLSNAANDVLAVAAVIGREFEFTTLAAVSDVSEEELTTAIEEAVAAAVIEERSQLGGARYRFTHAFFRQTLYEELIAPRRLRLHQQIARAMEQQYSTRLDEHAAELAEHFSQSSNPADLAKAVEYGERAAERSTSVYAFGEAARLLEQAAAVHEVLAPDDTSKRCDLLLALCDALLAADEPSRVEAEVAEEAFVLSEALDDADRAARACMAGMEGLLFVAYVPAIQRPRGREWVSRLDRHARDGTSGRIWADVMVAILAGTGARDFPSVFAAARALDDPDTVHFAAGFVLSIVALDDEPIYAEVSDEIGARTNDGARARWRSFSHYFRAQGLLRRGDRDSAETSWKELIELAQKAPDSSVIGWASSVEATMAAMDGHLEEAVEIALGLPGETGSVFVRTMVTHPLFWMGRIEDYFAMQPTSGAWEAYTFALAGREEEARAILAAYEPISDFTGSATPLIVMSGAMLLGEAERVRALSEFVEGVWRPVATTWPTITDRALGEAYAFLSEPQRSREKYAAALDLAVRMRWRPEIALARFGLAKLLFDHYPEERADALDHLAFAIDEFGEMKMQPYVEEALRLRLELQGVVTPPRGSMDAPAASDASIDTHADTLRTGPASRDDSD